MQKKPNLSQTVHWRQMRRLINQLSKMEDINISIFDTFHIRCYSTVGQEMLGHNVICHTENKKSIFVSDNEYEIFEIPINGEAGKPYGKFLTLIHNTSFDYWILADFEILQKTKQTKNGSYFDEFAEFAPYGVYDISFSDRKNFNSKKM